MTLDMPTPESLEAEADALYERAEVKERLAAYDFCSVDSASVLRKDAAIFREEAQAKRAKAARILKADIEAGLRTPSGTLVSTIESMERTGQKVWEAHLKDIGSVPWGETRKAVKL